MNLLKNTKALIAFICLLTLASCEITQETKFDINGSGTYSLGIDLSKMMEMGMNPKGENSKPIDTLIIFSDILKAKKDSIAKLSRKKQREIKKLERFSIEMKSDSATKEFKLKIKYDFNNVADLKLFGEILDQQNIKELDVLKQEKKDGKSNDFLNFNKSYDVTFNKKKFSSKISDEALLEVKKDTTIPKGNPMLNMIRFKTRYLFPYKIKKISHEGARILPNFKGIEINTSLSEITENPKYFDIEVTFER